MVTRSFQDAQSIRVSESQEPSPAPSSSVSPESPKEVQSTNALNVSSPMPTRSFNSTTVAASEDGAIERASVERSPKRRKLDAPTHAQSAHPAPQDLPTSDAQPSEDQAPSTTGSVTHESAASASKKRKQKATSLSRKRRKGKQRSEGIAESVAAETTDKGDGLPPQKPRRKGRKRAATPENAEMIEITSTLVKMSDLCRDSRAGKTSSRESRLQERDKEAKAKKAREQLQTMMEDQEAASPDDRAEEPSNPSPQASRAIPSTVNAARLAPQVRLVNGQIVQDEDSRMIDRHESVEARPTEDIQDEDELTRRVTSASYARRGRTKNKWDAEQTSRFYDGLRLFGTDFMTINRIMFPKLTRRAIKRKFTNEERADEELIKHILIHERRVPTLDEIESMSQTTFKDPSEVYKGMEEDRQMLEEEARKEKEAMEEVERQRIDEARKENEAADGGGAGKENEDVEILDDGNVNDGGGKMKKGRKRGLRTTKGKRVLASAEGGHGD